MTKKPVRIDPQEWNDEELYDLIMLAVAQARAEAEDGTTVAELPEAELPD